MASGNRNRNIKLDPKLFSDEATTTSEAILDDIAKKRKELQITNLSQATELIEEQIASLPEEESISAEQEIKYLFDKYYNGDRDVDISKRHANKEKYKQELIITLKRYGIDYIEKHHYPLSNDEKHIIRMDFFGTINKPHSNKLSNIYQAYISLKRKKMTFPNVSKKKNSKRKKETAIPTILNTTYPIISYDLSISPSWKLFRLFPRFHKLESRMLKTIQELNIPPEQLSLLSVYDYSDLLYRTFKKSEDSTEAHLFLGARQSFVKDVFNKHEQWIRNYLTRKKIHPRYIDILIKTAQSKGITGNINVTSDANTYMCEFAITNNNDFQKFIIDSIKSDSYASDIRQQIKENSYTIQGSAIHFLQSNQTNFEYFIKKQLIEDSYIDTIIRQFNRKIPTYVLKDIQAFINSNPTDFQQYTTQYKKDNTAQTIGIKNLFSAPNKQQTILLQSYIDARQQEFFLHMIQNNRSVEYANFSLYSLSEIPVLTDYSKDMITSFILQNNEVFSQQVSPEIYQEISQFGINENNIETIIPFIQNHHQNLRKHFKNSNILTFDELKNEFIETSNLAIQSSGLSEDENKLQRNFVLSNEALFKSWYIRFHTQKYKENANIKYQEISNNGIFANNEELCQTFIKERLSNFVEFAEQHNITSQNIIKQVHTSKLTNNNQLSQIAHDFIVQHNFSFKNFLLQQYLKEKERKFDLSLKNLKTQGISSQNIGTIHKFIIDNQALYSEYLNQGKLFNNQTQQIYSRISNNKSTTTDKEILKSYLNANIYNYLIFQQDDAQLIPYVKNIINDTKQVHITPTTLHWLKEYTIANQEKFTQFMQYKGNVEAENSEDLFNDIKFKNGNMSIKFNDGYVLNFPITVHHKDAIKDSGYKKITMKNIASINNFSNLCLYPDFWHTVMHNLDCIEPFEDKERFVSRLMPTDKDIIFFGGENPEDKLHYDYENDPRSKRTEKHLSELLANNYGRD